METKPDLAEHVEHDEQNVETGPEPQVDMPANKLLEAYQAAIAEHRMGFREALVKYRKALLWTAVMSANLIMEAYDNHLLSNFFALPAFQEQFGVPIQGKGKKVKYEIEASWQSGMAMGKLVGMIIGVHINPWCISRFGYRYTTLACLFIMTVFIFMLFFAKTAVVVLLSEFFFNIPFGTISVLCQAYTLELMPLPIRHWGPTYCQFTRNIGTLLASAILQGFVGNTTSWAWRIPVAIQWVWPIPLAVAVVFAPESPWWLVRQGRSTEALAVLDRLSSKTVDNDESLALIEHTISLEAKLHVGSRFRDIFRGSDLRRTEIEVGVRASDAVATFGLAAGTFFFENAGFSAKHAFALNLGTTALVAIASLCTMFILARVGRRRLWLVTYVVSPALMLILGTLATQRNQSDAVIWAQGVVLMINNVVQGLGSAPTALLLGTEVASVQLRQQTMGFGANVALAWQICAHFASPYLISATALNLGGKAAWVPFVICTFIFIWSYFRVPETKGRSVEELDYMFSKGVSARDFRKYVIPVDALYEGQKEVAEHTEKVVVDANEGVGSTAVLEA